MAEKRQYVAKEQENGSVMISEEVISAIVVHAVSDVEGLVCLSNKPSADMTNKKNWGRGVKVEIGQHNEVYIDCNMVVAYGHSVVNVAKAVQKAVAGALESIANVSVAAVNVNVCGVVHK